MGRGTGRTPSRACIAVAKDFCNVHLDNIGIRLGNYNANAPQHVADELVWQDKILPAMLKIGISPHFVDILRRVHPVVPNLRQVTAVTKEWQPRVGVELDIARVRSKDIEATEGLHRLLARVQQRDVQAAQQHAGQDVQR